MLFMGVDLGTSALKGGFYDLAGRQHGFARVTYPTHKKDGIEEQHAEDWWHAFIECVQRANVSVDVKHVAGIAIGGHAPSPAFVDDNLRSLFPVQPWFAPRAVMERMQVLTLMGRAPCNGPERLTIELAARAMWHRTHAPETFARVRCILHSGDYLAGRLTGECVSTIARVPWLFEAVGLSPALLPDRGCNPGEIVGPMQTSIAEELRLPPAVPVIAGGLDSLLAAIGSGLSETGDACLNSGSASVVAVMGLPSREGRFEWNGLPIMSRPVSPGGRELTLACDELGLSATTDPIGKAVRLQPAVNRSTDSPTAKFRLLLDVVLLNQRRMLEQLEQIQPARQLRGVGGLAASTDFCQLQADVLGRKVDALAVPESGSLGAALLATTSLGFHTPATAASHMVRTCRTFAPRSSVAAFYERQFRRCQ